MIERVRRETQDTQGSVQFEHVGKTFKPDVRALTDFCLDVEPGELMVLVGPSGCGKTTALRIVAGLDWPSEGEIRLGGEVITDVDPRHRDIAMVFQNYALYPHMSVYDNIAFGLRTRRVARHSISERVHRMAGLLDLSGLLNRKPGQLSGGQRQRVAMGRAIVRHPSVFLMDEPLSNLDARLRTQMRAEVAQIQRELGITTIYVTHDQVEAMTMGQRVAVMRGGVLQQLGAPQDVYDAPANLFVASFVGSPPMNLVQARLARSGDGLTLSIGDQRLEIGDVDVRRRPGLVRYLDRLIALGIRAECVRSPRLLGDSPQTLWGEVRMSEALGPEVHVHLEVAANRVLTDETREVASEVDAAALGRLESDLRAHRTVIVARFEATERFSPGERIEVGIDVSRLHYFDLETGRAIDGVAA